MRLREIIIKNFRCLINVTFPVQDTTVLVGENNTGKTALLDALRIALTRMAAGRGTPFEEYDYHMNKAGDSSETCEGIVIELWFREDKPDEWPNTLLAALTDIIVTDPYKDLDSIGMRLSCKYDEPSKQLVSKWEFLTLDGKALGGKGANPGNVGKFLNYIRLFYLSAIRDSTDEFSPRSQFWGRILRDLKITKTQQDALQEQLAKLNEDLLKADDRVEKVRTALNSIQKVMALGTGGETKIRALSIKPLELLSRAEVVIRGRGGEVDFPLSRHGQGTQSLAVLYLFQAYIDVLLKPTFELETEAIWALEEPEAHLHPHAARSLGRSLQKLESQMIASTHSPYFIQDIPFIQIRMFRQDGPGTKILYIKRSFSVTVPIMPTLLKFCTDNAIRFTYNEGTSTLTISGKMHQKEYRDLLTIYAKQPDVHADLKHLLEQSQIYLANEEIENLETYAKRIRGEILFARAWLLCEGQSEYLLLRYFSELLAKHLDEYGISIIDFQNNGSPGAFVGLAQTFEIPWIMLCDNDTKGKKFVEDVHNRGLTDTVLSSCVRPLPGTDIDLELFLVRNGFIKDYVQILESQKIALPKKSDEKGFDTEVANLVRNDRTGYAQALIDQLKKTGADASRVPLYFASAINDVIAKAH